MHPAIAAGLEVRVAERSPEEVQQRLLYGTQAPNMQSQQQQIGDAISIKTMRGVWSLRETYLDKSRPASEGQVTFVGALYEGKGVLSYAGQAEQQQQGGGPQQERRQQSGRGPWIIKSDGFGRSPAGRKGGMIEQKALFKIRKAGVGTFTYAGRINVVAYDELTGFPDASIDGDLVQLINGGKPKGGSERKVGSFHAELLRPLTADEEQASTDSAAAGGEPEALRLATVGAKDELATVQTRAATALYSK